MRLRPLPPRKVIKVLVKLGFKPVRQHGSHMILKHPDGRITVVPIHPGEDMFLNLFLKKGLVDGIKKEEIFAGMTIVFFKDHSEAWMSENLVEIEKPELVKEAERYLRKVIQGCTKENETSHPAIQYTTLNKWTGGD